MKRTQLIAVLIVLSASQLFCSQATPTAAPPPVIQSVGNIQKVLGDVEAGPETSMDTVNPQRALYNNDAVHVFNGGKANLDFNYGMTFTLYNDTVGGGTNVLTEGTSHQAVLKLSQGGLKGHNPAGSQTTVEIPNGVKIFILGTQYFITYDPGADTVWVYNFDGTIEYQLANGTVSSLSARALLKIESGQITHVYQNNTFSVDDFDTYATDYNSPIQGLDRMLRTIPVTGSTPTPTRTPTNTPTATMTRTPTATPTITPTPIPCYLARFVKDVTIPDGTSIKVGTQFTKTWRLKNMGSCNWDSSYQIVFVSGTSMSEAKAFPWTGGVVGYGQSVDISVNLSAPYTAGKYQSDFRLLAPDGTVFGLGVENKAFWVRIVVPEPNTPPPAPVIVSPSDGSSICSGYSVLLDWSEPYDPSGIAYYEVQLWTWNGSTWVVLLDQYVSAPATEYLTPVYYSGSYAWRVLAQDNEGAWGTWSGYSSYTSNYCIG